MQLHSLAFEQALHAAARVELRKSPEKWRRYLWTYLSNPPGWAVGLPLLLALLVILVLLLKFTGPLPRGAATSEPFPIQVRLMIELVLTYSLCLGGPFAVTLKRLLVAPEQRLPVNHRRLFDACITSHCRGILVLCPMILGPAGFILGVVGWGYAETLVWQSALAASFLHAVSLFSLGLALSCRAASRPAEPYQAPNSLRGLPVVASIFSSFILTWNLPRLMDAETLAIWIHPIYASLPGGWTGELYFNSLEAGQLTFSVALLPTALLLLMAPWWHRSLRARFINLAPDHQFVLLPDEVQVEWTRAQAEADLRRRLDSPAAWWQAGWVEWLVGRVLTPKQRELAELMLPLPPGWSTALRDFTGWIVALLGIGWFLQTQQSLFCLLPYLLATGLLVFHGYGLNLDAGRAGMPVQLPVSVWDYTRVWMKVVWVRSLCVASVYVLAAIFWGTVLKRLPVTPALVCLTAWLIGPALAAQKPLFRVLGAARPTRWWQRGWTLLAITVLLGTLVLPLVVVSLSLRGHFPRAPYAMAIFGVGLHVLLLLVNWSFAKQFFDLASSGGLIVVNPRRGHPVSLGDQAPTPTAQVP